VFSNHKRMRDLQSRTLRMVRDFLLEEVYSQDDFDELAKEWGTTYYFIRRLLHGNDPFDTDILALIEKTRLDFGVVIRDPGTGREVSFFAEDNLSGQSDSSYSQDEIVEYSDASRKSRGEGIDFLPRVHPMDGDYSLDEEDAADVEFTEEKARCENCLSKPQLPGCVLCEACVEAGVQADSPEKLHDPIEVLAAVDAEAERARQRSEHLLRQSRRSLPKSDEEEEGGSYLYLEGEEAQYDPEFREKYLISDDEEEE